MTEKRFFRRDWEESYYIFDSQTISENEFDEKVKYEDYQAFADSLTGDEVVELLNKLHDENEQLKQQIKELQSKNNDIEWLKNNTVWEQMPTNRRTYTQTRWER